MRRHRGMSTVRRPMMTDRIKRSNLWTRFKIVILAVAAAAVVLVVIFFGFPLIEDLIRGVDPSARYQPKVEAKFEKEEQTQHEEIVSKEIYTNKDYKMKNEPYADGDNIIFTTQKQRGSAGGMDGVVVYNTQSGEARLLVNTEKKYDEFINPVLSGNIAVFLDSMADGGGRILGYDMANDKQFVIKEYAYAAPQLALSGDRLAFMQWAGDETQRLYVYDVKTREAATVKLYDKGTVRGSAVDISAKDMVWAESDGKGASTLKRIAFAEDGTSKYDNYNFGDAVYAPKTNGKDIVFKTKEYGVTVSLMLSVSGGAPVMLADGVSNYGIGDDFVVYSKGEQLYVAYTDAQETSQITSDVTKNILASANGNGLCYYDMTDKAAEASVADDVAKYAYVPKVTGAE
ncbi:MAG: hypothetical protein RSB97_05925 [Christensenella sp.]